MKRLLSGFVIAIGFISCAQHDPKSPDTAGSVPYDQPGVGVDTAGRGNMNNAGGGNQNGAGGANHNNDGSNNNETVNTGDTGTLKRQQ